MDAYHRASGALSGAVAWALRGAAIGVYWPKYYWYGYWWGGMGAVLQGFIHEVNLVHYSFILLNIFLFKSLNALLDAIRDDSGWVRTSLASCGFIIVLRYLMFQFGLSVKQD